MASTATRFIRTSAFPAETIRSLFLVDTDHLRLSECSNGPKQIEEIKDGSELIEKFRTKLSGVVTSRASKAVGASTDASDATEPMICLDPPAQPDEYEGVLNGTQVWDLEEYTRKAMHQTAYWLLQEKSWYGYPSDCVPWKNQYANRSIAGRKSGTEVKWDAARAKCLLTDPTLQSIRYGSRSLKQEGTGGADASQSSAASDGKTPAQPEDTVMRDADDSAAASTEGNAGGLGLGGLPKEGDERGLFV